MPQTVQVMEKEALLLAEHHSPTPQRLRAVATCCPTAR